jgi:exopolyphosphatase / guanosine-5'-triphosphate,3'-diphosphate pyrophosphatase
MESSISSTPPPVAAIDIGTNSVLLLIAADRGGTLAPVTDRATIARLGQGVDRTRVLSAEAVERTLACLVEYAAILREHDVHRLDVVGTSAMRDAEGGGAFLDRAETILGVRPRVITGAEEAQLTFEGSLAGLALRGGPGPVTVVDIGGGSTEVILGRTADGGSSAPWVERARSLDIGSVRLHERHVRSDPPAPAETEAARLDIRQALAELGPPPAGTVEASQAAPVPPLVGVAGTVTTLAAIHAQMTAYDGSKVHGSILGAGELATLAARLAALTVEERRRVPGLEPKRADVIVMGALIALEVLQWARAGELVVSDRGVRWGIAQRLSQ